MLILNYLIKIIIGNYAISYTVLLHNLFISFVSIPFFMFILITQFDQKYLKDIHSILRLVLSLWHFALAPSTRR